METGLYLVERYLPDATAADAASAATRVEAATEQLAAQGISVRYLGATFIPADETCFYEFEAATQEAVEWANERANVPFARILPAVRLSAQPMERSTR
jgi:Nickel responsive protein SCO4226-like